MRPRYLYLNTEQIPQVGTRFAKGGRGARGLHQRICGTISASPARVEPELVGTIVACSVGLAQTLLQGVVRHNSCRSSLASAMPCTVPPCLGTPLAYANLSQQKTEVQPPVTLRFLRGSSARNCSGSPMSAAVSVALPSDFRGTARLKPRQVPGITGPRPRLALVPDLH